ncbi:xanthine dehydrogenase accessory factor [Bacillus sp. SORGH_AS 510]|uniref:XdhC family protein n=1 Tax=Bacillus sp. SORGH_AS_0510 TaxID=3041771 RepID=UPI00277E697E|nr:XdhC family protein [Bacillus sp. SORGH_AS_0510]MDQ1146408.1 xanthine dehydrogenase accessory factor [Bacillus sp. SORGH_AS_0510]
MDDIYPILDVMEQEGEKVLATIIRVNGSAYKKEGASMIFFEDGSYKGMLSAGCLETDLSIRVRKVMMQQEAEILQYDLSEESDLGWGQGAGCNGTIDILLEPVTDQLVEDFKFVKKLLNSQKPVIVLKRLDELGEYVFIEEEGASFGNWSGNIPVLEFTSKSGIMTEFSIFQHTFQPKPRLIVFGAGPDAKPLVALAVETGFSVIICDWRKEFCQKSNFPKADLHLIGTPNELIEQLSFSPYDFAVIMSHHFHRDQEFLHHLLHENIRYLGVLGPSERTKRLLNGEDIPPWLYSPIGTPIKAVGPDEIAVSIVAEMIEVWRTPRHERVELLWTIPD